MTRGEHTGLCLSRAGELVSQDHSDTSLLPKVRGHLTTQEGKPDRFVNWIARRELPAWLEDQLMSEMAR